MNSQLIKMKQNNISSINSTLIYNESKFHFKTLTNVGLNLNIKNKTQKFKNYYIRTVDKILIIIVIIKNVKYFLKILT